MRSPSARPDIAAALLAVLESWDRPMRAFKEADALAELIAWLSRWADAQDTGFHGFEP